MKMVGLFIKSGEKLFPFSAVSLRGRNIHEACSDAHRGLRPGPSAQWVGPHAHTHNPTPALPLFYQTLFKKHKFK